ncbi:5-carboxymethyl-2-hydroxymuconate Delta-isomerase [Streptomyces sp. TLI_105]|uniref:5-carboxymethyl-2-hydroxymuconate Delta-isomerase n=1 Tax=Streptomyces sp. TLI_105 TaxID=1881019 RepID=UPI0008969FBF|nr:isomerase [Streptomyces sp. TLI_105]SED52535.1 5-carboxymethyl-2-hydroxymuconate isomerase [Streptomyces sp. TLI_105]
MPQITVDYSAPLDRRGFALALHPLVVKTVDATLDACKTRFREVEEVVVGGGGTDDVIVHVEIALLSGRTDEAKARLSEAVLHLLPAYLKAGEGVRLSVEVRDLEASYRKV